MEESALHQHVNSLANEVGAKAEKIYTLESKEDNKDYLQSIREMYLCNANDKGRNCRYFCRILRILK